MSKELQHEIDTLRSHLVAQGQRIQMIERRLSSLKEQPSSHSPPPSGGSGQAWLLSKKMEAKQRMADDLKHKHCSEGPLTNHWDSEKDRQKYSDLIREISGINKQIAAL